MKRAISALATLVIVFGVRAAQADDFSYNPPGQLVPGSGQGRFDENVYAPGIRFPIETGPAFANSQVWGHGGNSGPGGSQCDIENFSYPWSDNYCETRSWDMPLCPAGIGHQGQDIRASSCEGNVHWAVSAEAGTVTSVGSYSVYITAGDGTRYDYLHMDSVQVSVGDEVAKGQHVGKVSNVFGGTPTSVHLHFNLRQNVEGVGNVYVPPYMSIISAYQALIGPAVEPPSGVLDEVSCEALRGWTQSPSDPQAPIDVRLYFDGAAGDASAVGHPFLADLSRDDLCEALGSCEHAFQIPPPLSLFDSLDHAVHGYASDGSSAEPELASSPATMNCAFEVPNGVRRKVVDNDSANAWHFSPFWDEMQVSDEIIASLDEGAALDVAPRLVAAQSDPERLWIVDAGVKRSVPDEIVAIAWALDPIAAELVTDDELAGLAEGAPIRSRPIVLRSATGDLWLVDDEPTAGPSGEGAGGPTGDDGSQLDGPSASEGCACTMTRTNDPRSLGLLALLAMVGAARRRRRS